MTMRFFGPECSRKEGEIQVDPPIGEPCGWCDEPIRFLDMGTIDAGGTIMHYECQMRSVLGSSGHQLGKCSCFGGTMEDPVGLTKRQAAIHAYDVFKSRRRHA